LSLITDKFLTPATVGTAAVKATSTQDTSKSGTASVNITAPAPLEHGALIASPPLYASAATTAVTLSIWLPDPDLNITSVIAHETDKSGAILSTKGTLNDSGSNGDVKAGDKIYTLQFNVSDTSPSTHYYGVSYKSISSGAAFSTEVGSTTSVPIVSVTDPSTYSLNIQDSISRLLSGASSYQAIYPLSATAINQTALASYISAMVSVMGNLQQLSSYDLANPQVNHVFLGHFPTVTPYAQANSFWTFLATFVGLGDVVNTGNSLASEQATFLGPSFNPNDPAVAGLMTWLTQDPTGKDAAATCVPDVASDPSCRTTVWVTYSQTHSAGMLDAAKSTATSAGISEYTGLAVDGAGELLSSVTDLAPLTVWSIEQGAGIATDYFVDNFTAPSGRQMLVLGNVSQGQSTLLPNGSHDIILASTSARAESPGITSPAISSLAPALVLVGAEPQTLTINGTGFLTSSTVRFNGTSRAAIFVSSTQLTIQLNSADLGTVGTYPVVVTNPAPGGGASAAVNFTVTNGQTTGQWTWMGGSNTAGAPSIYGTQGVPATGNVHGARDFSVSWTDGSGNFWLFGGVNLTNYNDLWKFNPTSNMWTWVSGGTLPGVYGTRGVPDAANLPPGRMGAVSWVDASGNLWLFGGSIYDSTGINSWFLNDLWKYNPTSNMWTWVSGANSTNQGGVYGTQSVPDAANVPGARAEAVSWIDGGGNLWLFGGQNYSYLNDLWKFNPTTNLWTWVSGANTANQAGTYGTKGVPSSANVPGARDRAVSWIDSGGNLWLFGGQSWPNDLNDLWKFSSISNMWTWVSGADTTNQTGIYGTKGVPDVANIPGAREGAVSWVDSSGNLWFFGGYGSDSTQFNYLNDLWEFNPTSKAWTWVSGSSTNLGAKVPGVYGTMDVPAAANVPGGRGYGVSWFDKSGNVWLFGGDGYDSTGSGLLNDLWRYQP
jgi:hypothetical protein